LTFRSFADFGSGAINKNFFNNKIINRLPNNAADTGVSVA
jgi:hypothetical protein